MNIKANTIIDKCSKCKKERKIYNKENTLCKSCYNQIHRDKEKQKECVKRWKEKNPNYFKEYHKK